MSPNDRDLAALPYARAENAAALAPFTFTSGPGNLNLGLDRGHALVSTGGVASYRIADGGNALTSLPDRYLERLTTLAPTQGYRYGSYGDGGTFDLEPVADEHTALRVDAGPDESVAARYASAGLAAAAGASYGSGVRQARADIITTSSLLGGTLRSVASLAGSGTETYAALGTQYATASRRYETFVDANVTRSTVSSTNGVMPQADGSSIFPDMRVRNRGPLNLEVGARFRTSTGYYIAPSYIYQVSGVQQEAALYSDVSFSAAGNTLRAAAGVTQIVRSGYVATDTTFAPIGSLDYAYALGPHFTLKADGAALPRIPTLVEDAGYFLLDRSLIPVDRDQLIETGISYTDRSRIRADVEAFRQRITGASSDDATWHRLSLAWQIAPSLSGTRLGDAAFAKSRRPNVLLRGHATAYELGLADLRLLRALRRDLLQRAHRRRFQRAALSRHDVAHRPRFIQRVAAL